MPEFKVIARLDFDEQTMFVGARLCQVTTA